MQATAKDSRHPYLALRRRRYGSSQIDIPPWGIPKKGTAMRTHSPTTSRTVTFIRHYIEMVVVMFAGMIMEAAISSVGCQLWPR